MEGGREGGFPLETDYERPLQPYVRFFRLPGWTGKQGEPSPGEGCGLSYRKGRCEEAVTWNPTKGTISVRWTGVTTGGWRRTKGGHISTVPGFTASWTLTPHQWNLIATSVEKQLLILSPAELIYSHMLHMSKKAESYRKESTLGHLVHIFLVMHFSLYGCWSCLFFNVFSGLQSILVQFQVLLQHKPIYLL